LASIRVLLAAMPAMLADIIINVIASQQGIDLVGEIASRDGLLRAAVDSRADVVVIGEAGASGHDDYHDLLRARPELRILEIAADGRSGFLVTSLGEVSAASLIEAIRGPASSGGAGIG
jgi:hypothetical protein